MILFHTVSTTVMRNFSCLSSLDKPLSEGPPNSLPITLSVSKVLLATSFPCPDSDGSREVGSLVGDFEYRAGKREGDWDLSEGRMGIVEC